MGRTHSPNFFSAKNCNWGIDTSIVEHDTFKDLKKQVSIRQADNSLIPRAMEGELAANTVSAGLDRTDGSTRRLVVQQRESLRH